VSEGGRWPFKEGRPRKSPAGRGGGKEQTVVTAVLVGSGRVGKDSRGVSNLHFWEKGCTETFYLTRVTVGGRGI